MKRVALGLLAAAPLLLGAVQDAPPPVIIPAPSMHAGPAPAVPSLTRFERTSLTCGGRAIMPTLDVEPFVATSRSGGMMPPSIALLFEIDAGGRTLGVERLGATPYLNGADDLAPALAATRFAPGQSRENCTAIFTVRNVPIASAPPELLARYYGMPHRNGPHERKVYDALKPEGADCTRPSPEPRAIHHPPYSDIAQAPGTASFVVLAYDINARGKPVRARTIGSEGNAALDRGATAAVSRSRFGPKARTGCVTRYYRRQPDPLKAPPVPEPATFVSGNLCRDLPSWTTKPNLVFPDNYARRGIEGWAIIGFDVAPWGVTGNVRVLASEPTSDFGEAAKRIVSLARLPASPTGLSGCAERVKFLMPAKGAPEPEPDEPVISVH